MKLTRCEKSKEIDCKLLASVEESLNTRALKMKSLSIHSVLVNEKEMNERIEGEEDLKLKIKQEKSDI